jgi:hypothetical protein
MQYFLWLPFRFVENACFIVVWCIYSAHICMGALTVMDSYVCSFNVWIRMTWQKLIRGLLMSVGKLMTTVSIHSSIFLQVHLSQAELWIAWNHRRQEILSCFYFDISMLHDCIYSLRSKISVTTRIYN